MEHRDFDTERAPEAGSDPRVAATFTIGGQTFSIRRKVRPEVFGSYEGMSGDENAHETTAIMDALMLGCLIPEDCDRWLEARRSEDPAAAIDFSDLVGVVPWVIEKVLSRPLAAASSSSPGQPAPGGPALTVVSSSPAQPAPTPSTPASSPTPPSPSSTTAPIATSEGASIASSPMPTALTQPASPPSEAAPPTAQHHPV